MSVAVIIPTYNRQEFILRAIASAQQQACDLPIEIFVVNDGSNDNTHQKLLEFCSHDKRIILLNQNNQGASAARNYAIKHLPITSKYITFLDSDDLMCEHRLRDQIPLLESDSGIDYLIGKVIVVNEIYLNTSNTIYLPQSTSVMTHSLSGAIFRRSIFDKIGLLNPNLKIAEDLDFFLRLAEARIPFLEIIEPCIYYVQHKKDHLTKDKLLVAKCVAKAIAMSIARRRNTSDKLLIPKFNIESLRNTAIRHS